MNDLNVKTKTINILEENVKMSLGPFMQKILKTELVINVKPG